MKLPPQPRLAVVGSGALGGYVGARLAHAGADVHFLVRNDFEALREKGWQVESSGEQGFVVNPAQTYRDPAEIGPVDVVLIALKTTQNTALAQLIAPLISPQGTLLLTLQNGMGATDQLEHLFPDQPVAAGLCYIAVNRIAPGHVINQAPRGGLMRLAGTSPEAAEPVDRMCALIGTSGIQCEVLGSLEEALWRKLMWNVPFNGLPVAMGGCGSEVIVEQETHLEIARALMEELRSAANARGGSIEPEFGEQLIDYTRRLGHYRASTVVDFLAGRSLEVEAIWGEPLRRGRSAGVAMPHLATLHSILRGIDDQRSQENTAG